MSGSPEQVKIQRTVLIIDDQQSVRLTLEYLLGLAGYRAVGAESGAAALMVAEREVIDGALIDIHMPVLNGFDTCLRLQAQAGGRPLRVWFMTGAVPRGFERRSVELGALGMFAKPFDWSAVLARLEHGFSSPLPTLPPTTPAVGDDAGANTSP